MQTSKLIKVANRNAKRASMAVKHGDKRGINNLSRTVKMSSNLILNNN